jgi:hypothetical protein
MSLIFLYNSYSIAIPKYSRPLLLKIYVCVVALTRNLQRVYLYSITEFLYCSTTIALLLLLILIKPFYLNSKSLPKC